MQMNIKLSHHDEIWGRKCPHKLMGVFMCQISYFLC